MNKRLITLLSLAIIFQLFVLSGMYVNAALPLWTGSEIRVKTVPVDPLEISGQINLDFGHDGKLIGIEVLDTSRFLSERLLSDGG